MQLGWSGSHREGSKQKGQRVERGHNAGEHRKPPQEFLPEMKGTTSFQRGVPFIMRLRKMGGAEPMAKALPDHV